jgi:hypothetical protein
MKNKWHCLSSILRNLNRVLHLANMIDDINIRLKAEYHQLSSPIAAKKESDCLLFQ